MNLLDKNSTILVVGLGSRSGLSAANFLAAKGYNVYSSDIKHKNDLKEITEKLSSRVTVFYGNQNSDILNLGFDLIVLSPGVPKSIPLIKEAYRRNIPVIAEIELAYDFIKGKIIAITGTDGKSTTVSLVYHILKSIGIKSFLGGNIGIPLISLVEKTDDDSVTVVELSSFQLETINKFKPDVASILNITPDHLDRYDGMNDYFLTKSRITLNLAEDDFFVYNKDDKIICSGLQKNKAKKLSFSLEDRGSNAFFSEGNIFLNNQSEKNIILNSSRMQLIGIHNIQNTMAALLIVTSILEKMDVPTDLKEIVNACYSFKGLPHRMEWVGEFEGRSFINDSKATTIGAVEMALESIQKKGILILGGRTKGDNYRRLINCFNKKIRSLILIGESSYEFQEIFKDFPNSIADSLDDAIKKGMGESKDGDVILLSPGCASFDMFKNFEERGELFKKSFEKLGRGELSWR